MKKKIFVSLLAVLLTFTLFGCGSDVTGKGVQKAPPAIENAEEKIDANLRYFLGITEEEAYGNMGNRTPTSEAEQHAARKLYHHFTGKEENPNYDPDVSDSGEEWIAGREYRNILVTDLEDTMFTVSVDDTTRKSYNVEIRYTGGAEHDKQVIIGAGYDTAYGKISTEYTKQASTGALENGTGVAALMTLIDWCEETQPVFDFDLVFVFFGCSAYSSRGATEYANAMEPSERLNTLLMVNLHRLGGDRTYLYTDEVKTEHESFLRSVAHEKGLSIYTLPDSLPLIDGVYREGVYYAHFGMLGDHAVFQEWNIPSAYVFDGYYGGFNLSDLERKGEENLGGTKNDTYPELVKKRPSYKAHAADALSLLIGAFGKEGFVAAMTGTRTSTKDYTFWTNPFWANMIVIFIAVALIILLIILVKYFEKKYPYVPTVRKLKIAVFGMEYEDKDAADIFVDVKRPKNPFDGY